MGIASEVVGARQRLHGKGRRRCIRRGAPTTTPPRAVSRLGGRRQRLSPHHVASGGQEARRHKGGKLRCQRWHDSFAPIINRVDIERCIGGVRVQPRDMARSTVQRPDRLQAPSPPTASRARRAAAFTPTFLVGGPYLSLESSSRHTNLHVSPPSYLPSLPCGKQTSTPRLACYRTACTSATSLAGRSRRQGCLCKPL